MILIVGLGNPGEKYKKTRHNLGFMVVDGLQKIHGFSDWQMKKKFKAEISQGTINNQEVILAKPQTFMNDSGMAVKRLIHDLRFKNYDLFVVHDDLDLELGKIKVVRNRGSAGHKGIQSIIDQLATKDFVRFRLGIGSNLKLKMATEDFVLKSFTKEENEVIKETIKKTCQLIVSYEFNCC